MKKIAQALGAGGHVDDAAVVRHVSTDTRELPPGCLFVALRGDRFDGNDYVAKALAEGAAWAVAERLPEGCDPARVLLVEDGRQALLAIAGLYRRSLDVRVAAVTGSVGKTTTKEMVACVMAAAWPTLKTQQNLNNEIGVSQTILQLEESHRVAVLEMGMDGPGQIAPLSLCAAPDIGIVTNVGVSHLERFGSREGILREKLDIARGMAPGAPLILGADNDLLATVRDLPQKILRYSLDGAEADVRAKHIREYATHTNFEILYEENRYDAQIPCMGRHNVGNALAAFLAGVCLGVEPRIAAAALKNYQPAGMRQKVVSHAGITVVEDCYNASPDSMYAALATLGTLSCDGKRIAVLSDMLELGEGEREFHRQVGRYAASQNLDAILCTGPLSIFYMEGARGAGRPDASYFATKAELWQHLKSILAPGDVVWFKASRGMRLEEVIESIYKEC